MLTSLPDTSPRNAADLDFRFERKLHAVDMPLSQIELLVKLHPAHFYKPFPERWINNVYFDTPRHNAYKAHVHGTADRQKYRIRWYGDRLGHIEKPVLEIKGKKGLVGSKLHFKLKPFDFDGGFNLKQIQDDARSTDSSKNMSGVFCSLIPTVFNRYRRQYFVTSDQKFRLTVDTNLSFRAIKGFNHSFRDYYEETRLSIIEIKYDSSDDKQAQRIISRFPFRVSKFSKYIMGVSHLSGAEA